MPEWENAPADQIVPTGRNWTVMRSSAQLWAFGMLPNGDYSVFKNTVEPRTSQTVVPVALRKSLYITFYEKSRISNKWTFEDVPQARATAAFWGGMLQWNNNFGCGPSFVHVCVQDAPQIKATASFWSGMLQRNTKCGFMFIHFLFRSGWGHFRVRIRRSNTMSELVHIALFGHLSCSDLHQAVFELWYTGPRQRTARCPFLF